MEGIVKFFNASKGWGFITTKDGSLFVHRDGLKETYSTLNEGDKVVFDVSENKKGPCAINVSKIEDTRDSLKFMK